MFGHKPLFNKEDLNKIAAAIQKAESMTNGEIRVCVVPKAGPDIVQHAIQAFTKLGMSKTKERMGVLIMLSEKDRRFAIIGDEGIHSKVRQVFWNDMIQILEYNFRQQFYFDGLHDVILKMGLKLAEHAPRTTDHVNELPDEVVFLK